MVTPKKRRRSKEQNQAAFLAAYRRVGNITAAAQAARISRVTHQKWMADEDYRKRFEDASDEAIDLLEKEARRRAEKGTQKPVFYQGQECGRVREYSDTLLIFLLKAARPEKYRDRHEVRVTKSDEEIDRELQTALAELAACGQRGIAAEGSQGVIEQAESSAVVPTSAVAETAGVPAADGP